MLLKKYGFHLLDDNAIVVYFAHSCYYFCQLQTSSASSMVVEYWIWN